MEGPTRQISQPSYLLASAQRLGRPRDLVGDLAGLLGRTGRRERLGLVRSLHGRQLRPGQKGGECVGPTRRGKGTKWMVVVDGQGIPLGSTLASASPAEVTLAEETLAQIKVPRNGPGRPKQRPKYLVADKAYD